MRADRLLGLHADELFHDLPTVKQHDRRDAADAEVPGDPLLLVGVHLREREPTRIVVGDALEHRHQRAAGSAPGRPEIDQHRLVRGCLDDGLREVRFRGNDLVRSFGHGDLDSGIAIVRSAPSAGKWCVPLYSRARFLPLRQGVA